MRYGSHKRAVCMMVKSISVSELGNRMTAVLPASGCTIRIGGRLLPDTMCRNRLFTNRKILWSKTGLCMSIPIRMRKKTSDLPCIFKLSLPKEKPVAENPLDEIRRDPERAGGVYYVTDLSHPVTPAPKGYTPFYINGYFRHGARQIDDEVTYPAIYGVLEKAHATNNLTDFGKALYERLEPFKKNVFLQRRRSDTNRLSSDKGDRPEDGTKLSGSI